MHRLVDAFRLLFDRSVPVHLIDSRPSLASSDVLTARHLHVLYRTPQDI